MVTARIVYLIARKGSKELCKYYRAPNHDDSQTEEPFPEVEMLEGTHQFYTQQTNEQGDDKRCPSETTGNKEMGE